VPGSLFFVFILKILKKTKNVILRSHRRTKKEGRSNTKGRKRKGKEKAKRVPVGNPRKGTRGC